MRTLFLDIDGVCITWRSHFARPDWSIKAWNNPDVITTGFLRNLIQMSAGPLRIVVSSTWRFNEKAAKDLLSKVGLLSFLHDDWRTTVYESCAFKTDSGIIDRKILVPEAQARGGEIHEWLKRHPEVKDYRILDDDTDILPHQLPYFVKCDAWDGLSGRDMKKLMDWAKGYKE